MIFPSDRLSRTVQICVVRADLLDPKLDPAGRSVCSMHFIRRIFSTYLLWEVLPIMGRTSKNSHFFECVLPTTNP